MKTQLKLQKILFLGLALIFCVSLVQPTQAAPAGVLQNMIDAAPDGGTVSIPAGSYHETLLVDKNLTLKGASADTTVLEPAGENQRVITVTAGHNLHAQDLRITDGEVEEGPGGGIYLAGGSLTLDYVQIDHNQAAYGGGVYQEGANWTVTITNSMIEYNSASMTGGGVYTSGSATLVNTQLYGNTATWHGGGLHVNSGSASLLGGSVSANHASNGNGGGVNVNDGLTISGTNFQGNTAGDSGGALTQLNAGKLVSISEAGLSDNSASNNGGGAYINSYLTVNDATFSGNTVDSGGTGNAYGGGLYAGDGLDGNHLTFDENSIKCSGCKISSGGGLYIKRASVGASSITHSSFDGNLAWTGSGISSDTTVELTLANTEFLNNGSLERDASGGFGGGVDAFWVHGDQLLFQNNKVMYDGGGLRVSYAVLTNTRFTNNTAAGSGGGVNAGNDFSGSNLLFAGNDAGSGSALYVNIGPAVLEHATITRPTQGPGSGIFIKSRAMAKIENSILTAHNDGIYVEGALTEDYNLFYDNTNDINTSIIGTLIQGLHSVHANPLFADPAADNYHLLWPSPAIALGTDLGVTTDLDGRARIGRFDSGAYQFWASIYAPLISK